MAGYKKTIEISPLAEQTAICLDVLSKIKAPINYVVVDFKSDFPDPVNGVITLEADKTYIVTTTVDLTGDRLVAGGICNLLGLSSETSFLTSTGLGADVPLITSNYTIVIESISIKDVGTGINIDGTVRSIALDWKAVNFVDVAIVGTINTCENFIYDTGAFLGAKGLKFTGTIGTVGMFNSLFSGGAGAGNIIELDANAILTRRFRIIYSSFLAHAPSVAIHVSADATIPIEGYILDTVNFAGGGTYTGGVTFDSDQALFVNCIGITNTTAIANLYIKNSAVETIVSETGVRYAVAGTSEVNSLNQKFTHVQANNSVRYDSSVARTMRIVCTFTIISGNNNLIGVYLGVKRGEAINPSADRIPESEVYVTTSGTGSGGRPDPGAVQALVSLNKDDEVYMIVQNTSNTNNITVEFMNIIVERTN